MRTNRNVQRTEHSEGDNRAAPKQCERGRNRKRNSNTRQSVWATFADPMEEPSEVNRNEDRNHDGRVRNSLGANRRTDDKNKDEKNDQPERPQEPTEQSLRMSGPWHLE